MKFSDWLKNLDYQVLQGDIDTEVEDVVYDSRKAAEGTVFVCMKGTRIDSHSFIDDVMEKGVKVFFTYSPRNILALSPESTEEARAKLHTYLCENLCVPVISDLEESLYAGTYLYGTDNHLSTEGVRIRTERVIRDLAEVLK